MCSRAKKEAIAIENVQRRATKLVQNIRNEDYNTRLRILGLTSLQYIGRRLRSDMVEVYKIFNDMDKIAKNMLSSTLNTRTRGHSKKK